MIRRLNHVGIVTQNLKEAMEVYSSLFGLETAKVVEVPEQGVKVALIPVGDIELEIMEPTDPDSGVAKFLEKRGEGLHHISFEVNNLDEELNSLASKGAKLIDKKGRRGVVASKIAFLHPHAAKGVLIELAQI